ncbi:ubiquinone biosynthesis methyltransferase coq5 [Metarhizium album ARSEF 1941]|uniref:Ubiquinone biosynthesis methyltransferase coq5 n=1 Tax=Metarhizium album (strain ARSEF 1941) TaxID=1081103 RepID=A0A0B2X010_METAS|nr:ubiquinone biosynthesis methyltransferase coq5 [Metarhizium album ARSEF 1941]KHN99022.1 ubiquinone biosynthesis methyltransferase coq5 [Metarhizium album ARSEF 1941]
MMSPGTTLGLLILGIMGLSGIIFWFFRSHVNELVDALLSYKRKLTDAERAVGNSTAAPSS